jgi:hypothetical protein
MNMGYCRFENTVSALYDCIENYFPTSDSEIRHKQLLIKACLDILLLEGYEVKRNEY